MLEVKNLSIETLDSKPKKLLELVSFELQKEMSLGLVGESGSGKSLTCLSILGLLPTNLKVSGKIFFNQELLSFKELKRLRGSAISYIPQNPISSLNPLKKIKDHLIETLSVHRRELTEAELKKRSLDILEEVYLANPKRVSESYPFELSGGMCQRVLIALALITEPELIIADEPTTALDIITQAEIIKLIGKLSKEKKTSLLLISHDLALVIQNTEQVIVLKNGKIIEKNQSRQIIENPKKEYTKRLINTFWSS